MLDNQDRNEIMRMLKQLKDELRKEFSRNANDRFEENISTQQSVEDVENALCELDK